jgi:hypothetical protein
MLNRIQALFMRLVRLVEEHPAPLRRFFQLYFAILAVRLCLEFFSSHRLFTMADVLHISLWFIFIVLAFLLQLHLFSGEGITKVTKLVVVGFTIALTAPIIDLIFSGGVGAKMNYLSVNSWRDVAYAYVTLGGPSLSRGATLGIRIEIILLVIASFNYVRTKRGSILWGMASALSIYTVLFVSGTVPQLLGWIVAEWHLEYGPDDQSTLLLLLCLDTLLLGIGLICYAPRQVGRILFHVPWGTVGIAGIHLAIGAGLALRAYPGIWQLNPTTLFGFPLLLALGTAMATLLGLQALQMRDLSPGLQAERARDFLVAASLGIGFAISERVVFVVAVIWGTLYLLNESPLRLRRTPLLRNLLETMALLAVALLGFSMFGGPMVGFPMAWLLPLGLLQLLGGLFVDAGRPCDGLLDAWLHARQGPLRIVYLVLLLGCGIAAGMFLNASPIALAMMVAALLTAMLLHLRWPLRPQWALMALWPAYWALAIVAWQ